MDMSEEPFCVEIYRKNAAHPFQDRDFVWKFTGKMRGAPVPTWTYTGPFYSYRKNPFSVATLFGEKRALQVRLRSDPDSRIGAHIDDVMRDWHQHALKPLLLLGNGFLHPLLHVFGCGPRGKLHL